MIEISAATEVRVIKFNVEVRLVVSHRAADLKGYDLIMKRIRNAEKNECRPVSITILSHGTARLAHKKF